MAIPPNNLLALALGFGAWQGKYIRTLDLSALVSNDELAAAVETMRKLGLAALLAYWDEDDADFKKDFRRIVEGIGEGLKVVRYG